MEIVLHCGGIPFNGDTIKTRSLGGSETAAYYAALGLAKLGHNVKIFTNHKDGGEFDGVQYVWAGNQTEQTPFGHQFHYYAMNNPCDVLIMQRHPSSFLFNWAARIKVLWMHDLALYRTRDVIQQQMWNIDLVAVVSQFHKEQVCEVYGINPDNVFVMGNGIDLELFEDKTRTKIIQQTHEDGTPLKGGIKGEVSSEYKLPVKPMEFRMLYSSRPERGLEHLVTPGGIMDKLMGTNPEAHLYVCGYENTTPQMAPFYEYLWQCCEELPNVTNLGALTKQELADVMRQCDLMPYTTEFEEVSCITAMECMAAGLPFLSSDWAALPETCEGSGSVLIPLDSDNRIVKDKFIEQIQKFIKHPKRLEKLSTNQLEAAQLKSWDYPVERLVSNVSKLQGKLNKQNIIASAREMIKDSDIMRLKSLPLEDLLDTTTGSQVWSELQECYQFTESEEAINKHYQSYYDYEKERGVDYGPENLDGNLRYITISNNLNGLPEGSIVYDYGCAHGHYTINLAKRFPKLFFVGVDITESNIEKARRWAYKEKLTNVCFGVGTTIDPPELDEFRDFPEVHKALISNHTMADCIIAAEVIEHVIDPFTVIDELKSWLKPGGLFIGSTPYGRWEAQGYAEHWPWRAHLWHFDRCDINEMLKGQDNINIKSVPSGRDRWDRAVGSYVWTFNVTNEKCRKIDYNRVFRTVPQQTLALCMIVRNAENTLRQCVMSAIDAIDELVLYVDPTTNDRTMEVIEHIVQECKPRSIATRVETLSASPLEQGFDEARNEAISMVESDWILWLDADEVLHKSYLLPKFLKHNHYNGYAIAQHHFSVEPAGILKTDLPCKIFRNNIGIKFYGVVHEHPETELNKGIGYLQLLPDMSISHPAYETEQVRRQRFTRNLGLMGKDREKYPERILGKFLWMRDLAQMCQYEMEQTHSLSDDMIKRAKEGIEIWEWLLDNNHLRMIVDGIGFYDTLVKVHGGGLDFSFAMDASKENGTDISRVQPVTSRFLNKEHLNKLLTALATERVKNYESRYF